MRVHARGRIVMWEGASLWILGVRDPGVAYPKTSLHSHHAVQITLALRGSFKLRTANHTYVGDCAAVAPDVPHTFEASGLVAHLFVEPESRAGRLLGFAPPIAHVDRTTLGELPDALITWYEADHQTDAALIDLGRAVVARLAGGEAVEVPDPRVRQMMVWAAGQLQHPVSLVDAARLVGLSSSRARHLFVEQTGLAFRSWFLWTRLKRALEVYAAGASLTDAALTAGFTDSAHFSRTFRSMFGITAASLEVGRDAAR
ncbi:MAG: AraC family transcriptional regulator [Pseudomonadota bacterium]|nr:AraC family transcriptional regulator [Pseudomonadota bacterium]